MIIHRGFSGVEREDTGKGIAPVAGGIALRVDLDALHLAQRNPAQVHIPGLGVVQTLAVQQYQHLPGAASMNADPRTAALALRGFNLHAGNGMQDFIQTQGSHFTYFTGRNYTDRARLRAILRPLSFGNHNYRIRLQRLGLQPHIESRGHIRVNLDSIPGKGFAPQVRKPEAVFTR